MTSTTFPGAILLTAASLLFAGCSVTAQRYVSVQRTVDFEQATSLDVETKNGAVSIKVDPNATGIEIEARMRASGRTQEAAQARVDAMDIDVHQDADGLVTVKPSVPGSWQSGDAASFTIVVPAIDMVDIRTSNGSVTISGTTRPSQIVTSNGAVRAINCSGGLDIETSNGSVTVTGLDGPLVARSSNGRMSVSLTDDATYPFDVRTSNGSVTVELGANWSGRVSASTSNGRVRLRDAADSVDKRGRSAEFELGKGGELSKARSSNGSIEVKVRAAVQY